MALPKTPFLYKAIDKAINAFGERHHITARQHFAPLLGFRGENASIQLGSFLNCTTYNPSSPKPLSVDHLAVLLSELGDERQIILDAMAKEYGGVFHLNIGASVLYDDVRDELMSISAIAGELSGKFLEFKDHNGSIDTLEAEELEQIALKARKELRAFEEMIKKVKG